MALFRVTDIVGARNVVESKATRAAEAARIKGYPLLFMTEPEEQPPHYWSSAPGAEEQGAVLANPNAGAEIRRDSYAL
jgi:hypothetical protein